MSDYSLPLNSCLLAGMSGSGKNTALYKYLNAMRDRVACIFIFDDKGEALARCGWRHASLASPNCNEVEAALQTRMVNFNPHRMYPGRLNEAFTWFCKWVFDASKRGRGKKIVFIDEIWRFQDRDDIPVELAMLAQMGRAENIELITATQHLHKVNASITGNLTELICFKMIDSVDLRKAGQLGANPEEIQALPLYHFLAYNLRSGESCAIPSNKFSAMFQSTSFNSFL